MGRLSVQFLLTGVKNKCVSKGGERGQKGHILPPILQTFI